ncbi:glucose-6-phosphate isomerase [uncultured Brevibacterium sp.]|uniref:glucose-6-phosphate isomerase n=1 Tax=uncultured Brevibacterium sp. TaxID=189678 RepID=UPI0025D24F5B|nr:glucose-6-phosphate isomerase [uncultured Brevibacterium sp.]
MTTTSSVINDILDNRIASRIAAQDATVWGPEAQDEASKRLGWVDLHTRANDIIEKVTGLAQTCEHDRVVLAGMGGSSLAPEVMSNAYGKDLIVCDSTHPDQVSYTAQDLDRTLVIIASKSGSTVETDSARRFFTQKFRDTGIDPSSRLIAITDPGSPLDQRAAEEGWLAVFHADPSVGGRYSALTPFGLVPAGLVGVDIAQVVADATSIAPQLEQDSEDNLAVYLGALLGAAHENGYEKLALDPHTEQFQGLGVWIEQLIAESTGKDGKGILPIAPQDCESATTVALGASDGRHADVVVDLPLGAQFLLWEYVTAIASYVIGVNPFDQPNVESAKAAMRELLAGGEQMGSALPVSLTDGALTVSGPADLVEGAQSAAEVVDRLRAVIPQGGYVGLQAFVDRIGRSDLVRLRPQFAQRLGVATTFGFGPRYLHSTGQYHKGGHANGVFVQITDEASTDFDVPETGFTFGQLIAAQSRGDANVLNDAGRPVLRFHLSGEDGYAQLFDL